MGSYLNRYEKTISLKNIKNNGVVKTKNIGIFNPKTIRIGPMRAIKTTHKTDVIKLNICAISF